MPTESALVVIVPEAEDLVGAFRSRFDPSAAAGVPAHITILYPFKTPSELSAEVIGKLRALFANISSFDVRLTKLERFPFVLYLALEPAEPLRQVINMVTDSFPEAPPYGGKVQDIIPHLTVAHAADCHELERIAADLQRQANGHLPIQSTVREIVLMVNESGRWEIRKRFALARDQSGSFAAGGRPSIR